MTTCTTLSNSEDHTKHSKPWLPLGLSAMIGVLSSNVENTALGQLLTNGVTVSITVSMSSTKRILVLKSLRRLGKLAARLKGSTNLKTG
jgi:hypothetical protein